MDRFNSESSIRSRQRVAEHGEVLTGEREVNAMLDLVKGETERIDSRFLEPACGDGNFLAEVLRRKLAVVRNRYGRNQHDYERYAFVAVTSIYGVELLADNAQACRERLQGILLADYLEVCTKKPNQQFMTAIAYALSRNILQGNALTMKCVDDQACDTDEPIVFSEWSLVTGDLVKRKDYRFDEMLEGASHDNQMSLFGMHGDETYGWIPVEGSDIYMPAPIKEFGLMSLYQVYEVEDTLPLFEIFGSEDVGENDGQSA